MIKTIIVGFGGHGRVVKDAIQKSTSHKIIGYLDEEKKLTNLKWFGPINRETIEKLIMEDIKFIVAIGNNKLRKQISETIKNFGLSFTSVIHPNAVIAENVKIGNGVVVFAGSVINDSAILGHNSIINTGSIIEHDVVLGDFTQVAPRGVLAGGVTLEEGVMVGVGATFVPQVNIGEWSIIGAGSVITKSFPKNVTIWGNPGRIIKDANWNS